MGVERRRNIVGLAVECANITGTYDGLYTIIKPEVDFEKIETDTVSNLDDFVNNSYVCPTKM